MSDGSLSLSVTRSGRLFSSSTLTPSLLQARALLCVCTHSAASPGPLRTPREREATERGRMEARSLCGLCDPPSPRHFSLSSTHNTRAKAHQLLSQHPPQSTASPKARRGERRKKRRGESGPAAGQKAGQKADWKGWEPNRNLTASSALPPIFSGIARSE